MSANIHRMVKQVMEGKDPRDIIESSLMLHPGSTARVNKSTTAREYMSDAAISLARGDIASIVGVGGGSSGVDHHVRLSDGRQAVVPFADLGESVDEQLVGSVVKVVLTKPIPAGAVSWLEGGYIDSGVSLPDTPTDDSAATLTFLMKADCDTSLEAGIATLKKLAGASFKSSTAATMTDWSAVSAG